MSHRVAVRAHERCTCPQPHACDHLFADAPPPSTPPPLLPLAGTALQERARLAPARRHRSKCFEPWMWLPLLAGAVALIALVALVLALYAALSLHTLHYRVDMLEQSCAAPPAYAANCTDAFVHPSSPPPPPVN